MPFLTVLGIRRGKKSESHVYFIYKEKYIYCNIHYIMSGDMQNCGKIHGDLEIDFLNR